VRSRVPPEEQRPYRPTVKPVEECLTPPQAWGLLSGTNITVPIRHELKDIGLSPPKIIVSTAMAQSGPTKRISGSFDPSGTYSFSPDLPGVGPASSDPPSEGSALPDP
jgi:hypothetical protein